MEKFKNLGKRLLSLLLVMSMVITLEGITTFASAPTNNRNYDNGTTSQNDSELSMDLSDEIKNELEQSTETTEPLEGSVSFENSEDKNYENENNINDTEIENDVEISNNGDVYDNGESMDSNVSTESEIESTEVIDDDRKEVESESELSKENNESNVVEEETNKYVELENSIDKISTNSEVESVDIATKSSIQFGNNKNYSDKFIIKDEIMTLTDNVSLDERINIVDTDIVLDLNGYEIVGPVDDYAIYVENATFTIIDTTYKDTENSISFKISTFDDKKETNRDEFIKNIYKGKIYGNSDKAVIYSKNSNININGGFIEGKKGSKKRIEKLTEEEKKIYEEYNIPYKDTEDIFFDGQDGIEIVDSNISINGGIVVGGIGGDSDDKKAGNGGTGIKANFNLDNYSINIIDGLVKGGLGGTGNDETIRGMGGFPVKKNDTYEYYKINEEEQIGAGINGDFGGGDGGVSISINGVFGEEVLNINSKYVIEGGQGGSKKNNKLSFSKGNDILPDEYIIDKDLMLPSRNQGAVGNCVVYAATAVAEIQMMKFYRENMHQYIDKKGDFNLSESLASYFIRYSPPDPLGNAPQSKTICGKGIDDYFEGYLEDEVFNYQSAMRGFCLESEGSNTYLTEESVFNTDPNIQKKRIVDLESYVTNDLCKDFNKVKSLIIKNGAVYAGFTWSSTKKIVKNGKEVFEKTSYKKKGKGREVNGQKTSEQFLNERLVRDKDPNVTFTGHAVALVGWDDDYDKNKFSIGGFIPESNGAWLAKNSHGAYYWISYENTSYDFYEMHYMPAIYDNCYFRDSGTYPLYRTKNIAKVSFKKNKKQDEIIKAVSVVVMSESKGASVRIYKNNKLLEKKVTSLKPGVNLIKISDRHIIKENDIVDIVMSNNDPIRVGVAGYYKDSFGNQWYHNYPSTDDSAYEYRVKLITNDVSHEVTFINAITGEIVEKKEYTYDSKIYFPGHKIYKDKSCKYEWDSDVDKISRLTKTLYVDKEIEVKYFLEGGEFVESFSPNYTKSYYTEMVIDVKNVRKDGYTLNGIECAQDNSGIIKEYFPNSEGKIVLPDGGEFMAIKFIWGLIDNENLPNENLPNENFKISYEPVYDETISKEEINTMQDALYNCLEQIQKEVPYAHTIEDPLFLEFSDGNGNNYIIKDFYFDSELKNKYDFNKQIVADEIIYLKVLKSDVCINYVFEFRPTDNKEEWSTQEATFNKKIRKYYTSEEITKGQMVFPRVKDFNFGGLDTKWIYSHFDMDGNTYKAIFRLMEKGDIKIFYDLRNGEKWKEDFDPVFRVENAEGRTLINLPKSTDMLKKLGFNGWRISWMLKDESTEVKIDENNNTLVVEMPSGFATIMLKAGTTYLDILTVKLNLNGGDFIDGYEYRGEFGKFLHRIEELLPDETKVKYNSKYGAKFLGWYDNEELKGFPHYAVSNVYSDIPIVYFAKWRKYHKIIPQNITDENIIKLIDKPILSINDLQTIFNVNGKLISIKWYKDKELTKEVLELTNDDKDDMYLYAYCEDLNITDNSGYELVPIKRNEIISEDIEKINGVYFGAYIPSVAKFKETLLSGRVAKYVVEYIGGSIDIYFKPNNSGTYKTDLTFGESAEGFFEGMKKLREVDLSIVYGENLKNTKDMFKNCTSLESVSLGLLRDAKLVNVEGMFDGCDVLKKIYFPKELDLSEVISFNRIFKNCKKLRDVTNLNVENINENATIIEAVENVSYDFDTKKYRNLFIQKNDDSKVLVQYYLNGGTPLKKLKRVYNKGEALNPPSHINDFVRYGDEIFDGWWDPEKKHYVSKVFLDTSNPHAGLLASQCGDGYSGIYSNPHEEGYWRYNVLSCDIDLIAVWIPGRYVLTGLWTVYEDNLKKTVYDYVEARLDEQMDITRRGGSRFYSDTLPNGYYELIGNLTCASHTVGLVGRYELNKFDDAIRDIHIWTVPRDFNRSIPTVRQIKNGSAVIDFNVVKDFNRNSVTTINAGRAKEKGGWAHLYYTKSQYIKDAIGNNLYISDLRLEKNVPWEDLSSKIWEPSTVKYGIGNGGAFEPYPYEREYNNPWLHFDLGVYRYSVNPAFNDAKSKKRVHVGRWMVKGVDLVKNLGAGGTECLYVYRHSDNALYLNEYNEQKHRTVKRTDNSWLTPKNAKPEGANNLAKNIESPVILKEIKQNEVGNGENESLDIMESSDYKIKFNNVKTDIVSMNTIYRYYESYTIPKPTNSDLLEFVGWYEDYELTKPISKVIVRDTNIKEVNVYAKYKQIRYELDLKNVLEEEIGDYDLVKDYNKKVILPKIENRKHAEFVGWYLDSEFTKKVDWVEGKEGIDKLTVYAKWDYSYTLKFEGVKYHKDNIGKVDNVKVKNKNVYTLPYLATVDKMKFFGWYLDPEYKGEAVTEIKDIEDGVEEVVVYAKYAPFWLKVNYNNLKDNEKEIDTFENYPNKLGAIIKAPIFSNDNDYEKIFEGWYFDKDFKEELPKVMDRDVTEFEDISRKWYVDKNTQYVPYTFDDNVVELYAKIKTVKKVWTTKFKSDDKVSIKTTYKLSNNRSFDDTIKLPSENDISFKNGNYKLTGFKVKDAKSERSEKIGDTIKISGNAIIEVLYEPIYVVSINLDGGKLANITKTSMYVDAGSTLYKSLGIPTKTNYIFVDWINTKTNKIVGMFDKINSNLSIKAKWREIKVYEIKYNLNGGEFDMDYKSFIPYQYKSGISLKTELPISSSGMPMVKKNGHTFEGWYFDKDFTNGPHKYLTDDNYNGETVYAKWKLNTNISVKTSSSIKKSVVLDSQTLFNKIGLDKSKITSLSFVRDNKTYTGNVKNITDGIKAYVNKTDVIVRIDEDINVEFPSNSKSYFNTMTALKTLNGLNIIDYSKVNNMTDMFRAIGSVKEIDLTGIDTSNVKIFTGLFNMNPSLERIIGLEYLDTKNATDMDWLFYGNRSLKTLDLHNWNFNKVSDFNYFAMSCNNLETIYLNKNISNNIINKIKLNIVNGTKIVQIADNQEVNKNSNQYIKDIKMSADSSSAVAINKLKNAGYTVINKNLNEGTSGKYIYIGYKTTTNVDDAITAIGERWFNANDRNPNSYIGSYHRYSFTALTDLENKHLSTNEGANNGSRWVYLYTTKDKSAGNAITNIDIIFNESELTKSSISDNGKYEVVVNSNDNSVSNFNRGNSGKKVYIRYSK